MKKIFAVLMVLMVVFAFAGINDWMNVSPNARPADADRVLTFDQSGTWKSNQSLRYFTFAKFAEGVLRAEFIMLDTNNTCVKDVALDAGNAYSVSLDSGEVLLLDYVWVDAGFDDSDFLCIETADSNGTELDTVNLETGGRRTNTYGFHATQDTTLYIMFGDTTSVSKRALLKQFIY